MTMTAQELRAIRNVLLHTDLDFAHPRPADMKALRRDEETAWVAVKRELEAMKDQLLNPKGG